jgi:hypothetical protein
MRGDGPIVSKPKPVKALKERKRMGKAPVLPGTKQDVAQELEALIRAIVMRRDGNRCIEADIDGGRCGGAMQWGHFVPRSRSAWLSLTLATFRQCSNHNLLHRYNDPMMAAAVVKLLGPEWLARITAEQRAHSDGKVYLHDLQERLDKYRDLLDNWPAVYTVKTLLARGYYG